MQTTRTPTTTRSRLAIFAAVLAVAPPVLAFVSMLIDMQFLGGGWGSVNEMTSLFLRTMMLSVPTSFIMGLIAIFRIRSDTQLTGTGLAVLAVLASSGIVAAVFYTLMQFGGHY